MSNSIINKYFLVAIVLNISVTCISKLSAQEDAVDPVIDRFNKRVDRLEIEEDATKAAIRRFIEDIEQRDVSQNSPKNENYMEHVKLDVANTKFKIGGFVQSDFIYDFNAPNLGASFITSAIPIGSALDPNFTFSYLQSRLSLQSYTNTELGVLSTLFEYDLFVNGHTPGMHIRHAWGELGHFGAGQYWSTFMDIDIFPNILDYQGPNAMVFARQVQLRYSTEIKKKFKLAVGIEMPYSDIDQANSKKKLSRNFMPDLALNLRYQHSRGHFQVAGVLHPVGYADSTIQLISKLGWGLNLTGLYKLNNILNDSIMFQMAYGHGIARYFNDISGLGYDGFVSKNNLTKKLNLLNVFSAMAFYNHEWSKKFSSSIGWGYLNLERVENFLEHAFHYSNYGLINFIYYPIYPVKVGLEYIYGMNANKSGTKAVNNRMQLSIMYKF